MNKEQIESVTEIINTCFKELKEVNDFIESIINITNNFNYCQYLASVIFIKSKLEEITELLTGEED